MATWIRLALITLLAGACSPATLKADGGGGDDDVVDANTVDAGPGTLTVLVLDDFVQPRPDVKVAFFESDGSLIDMVLTGPDGLASATVHPDAMVATSRFELQIEVIAGLQPGETVEMGPFMPRPSNNSLGNATVTIPTSAPGATRHLAGTCFLQDQTVGTAFQYGFVDNECTRGAATQDLLAIGLDANDNPMAYATVQAATPNGTFTFGTWNTDFRRPSLTLLDAPFDGNVDLNMALYRNDIEYEYVGSSTPLASIALDQNASVDLIFPPNFADKVNVDLNVQSSTLDRSVIWASNLAPNIGAQTVDLTAGMLPAIDQTAYNIDDPARPEWQFRINGDDEATAQLHVAFITDQPTESFIVVVAAAPPGHPSPFRLPALPADIITFNNDPAAPAWPPPSTATVAQFFSALYHATFIPGYGSFRVNRGLSHIFGDQLVPRDSPVGATARVSLGGRLF